MLKFIYNSKTKKLEYPQYSGILGIALSTIVPFSIAGNLLAFIIDRFSSPGALSENDSENIKEIIKEGKKQGVDEMEIEMTRDTALGLDINGIDDADITIGAKGNTKYVMKVKYK